VSIAGDAAGELLDAMPDAVLVVDRNGCMVQANARALALFGYARNELLGQPVEMLLPERQRAQHVAHHAQFALAARARPMGSDRELRARRRDGSEVPVEICLGPLQAGSEALVIAAVRDASERQAALHLLADNNRHLADAMEARDCFLAGMNHELRAPLASIIGFTGALLMKLAGPLTPEQESQLRSVQGSSKHLLALIDELLDAARLENDAPRLQAEPVECVAELGEVMASMMPGAGRKGLQLSTHCALAQVHASLDRRALRQVLLNLVSNAIKYTEQGSVRVSLEQQGEAGQEEVVLRVADTGRGIAAADQPRLFQPFARLDGGSAQPAGTGLGLYLTRRLVEAQGGSVACASEPGRGSEFTVRLPARRRRDVAAQPEAAA
jgi:PAS domain S-box-containing protein